MIFAELGLSNAETQQMTFENTGPRLFFVLEGVPFWGGCGNPRGNVLVGTKVVIGHSSFPVVERNSAVPVVLMRHRRPAPKGCREQL